MTTHTLDLPSTDPEVNTRLEYALPLSLLLAPYLASNPYFVDYSDAIDEVFDELVRGKMAAFANIRNMWVGNRDVESAVYSDAMVPYSAWSRPERELLIKQVNLLGMKLSNSSVVGNDAYLAISRFLGQYWFEKGRDTCIDFINFCLSSDLSVDALWTEDYSSFLPAGDPNIGTPVWEGGTWYPTTHVAITANGGSQIDPQTLTAFFYDVANYNLVLQAIDERFQSTFVTDYSKTKADIVAAALVCDNALVLSNVNQLGADPPPLNVFDWVATAFYSTVGTQVHYFLGQASGWVLTTLSDGRQVRIPVYGGDYQEVKYADSLPTKCYGTGEILCGDKLKWVPVPGSDKSKARIPAYIPLEYAASVESTVTEFIYQYESSIPEVEGGHMVSAVANVLATVPEFIGISGFVNGIHPRGYVGVSPIPLTSPAGMVELYPHRFVPYWEL